MEKVRLFYIMRTDNFEGQVREHILFDDIDYTKSEDLMNDLIASSDGNVSYSALYIADIKTGEILKRFV